MGLSMMCIYNIKGASGVQKLCLRPFFVKMSLALGLLLQQKKRRELSIY